MPVVEGRIWNEPIIYYKEVRLLLEYLPIGSAEQLITQYIMYKLKIITNRSAITYNKSTDLHRTQSWMICCHGNKTRRCNSFCLCILHSTQI